MRKKWYIWLIAILILAGAGGYFYYARWVVPSTAAAKQPSLQTATVRQGNLILTASATGSVIASSTIDIGFEDSGTLIELLVNVGDQVKKGDVLARAQTSETDESIAVAIAEAESAVLEAQKELDELAVNAELNRTTAMNDVTTYAQSVRDAQYTLDNYTVPPAVADMDAMEALDWAKEKLDTAREAFEPYKYQSSGNTVRSKKLTELANAQSLYDSAIKRLNYEYLLQVAEANLTKARHDYELYKDGPSAQDLALAESALKTAQAKLAIAQETKAVIDMVAPSDGTVMSISAYIGESVGTDAMLTLSNTTEPLLEIYLDETDLDNVSPGMKAEISFDAIPDQLFTGEVMSVYPGLETVSSVQVVKAIVQLDPLPADSEVTLPIGLNAGVSVISAQALNSVLVARDALRELDTDEYGVFVQENGELKLRVVEVGLMDVSMVQIISGLNPGEIVSTGIVATK